MKTLFIGATVINVFTGELKKENVLVENGVIVGVGDYDVSYADEKIDLFGKYLCPGFIDGHIHIESSTLLPSEFTRVALPHGTTAVIADPHEIANVCGTKGLDFMLNASEDLPLTFYIALPSCVPATEFDEAGAVLSAVDLAPYYAHPRVVALGEVMDYFGVVNQKKDLIDKIAGAKRHGAVVNGHAPLLSGKDLDAYICAGITDDHECSSFEEASERIRKGQHVMIRQGTAARNLLGLLPLFDEPYAHRCLLVTDDKHPADLLNNGHIDSIIRMAAAAGKNPVTGIRMATLWAAEYFGLKGIGAVAPGYTADLVVLDDLNSVSVCAVYKNGEKVAENGKVALFAEPEVDKNKSILASFNMPALDEKSFQIDAHGTHKCRVIKLIPNQLLTDEEIQRVDFDVNNGISVESDRLKIAVIERHKGTGHIGCGFICGAGLKHGAIASSVSHDSHNLIVIGTNEADMAYAANRIKELGGGLIVVNDSDVVAQMPLPYAGIIGAENAATMAKMNEDVRRGVHSLGVPDSIEPFMTMAFVSLPVIPHIKITTKGLVDVDEFRIVPLICE